MSNPKPGKPAGRPKQPQPLKSFKNAATGETRNSPYTDPNVLWWLGITLIIASGWSSGRLSTVFKLAWNPENFASNSIEFMNALKSTGFQVLFLFILVVSARAIPPLGKIWLVIIGGLWIMWLIKNPQIIQTLSTTAQNLNGKGK